MRYAVIGLILAAAMTFAGCVSASGPSPELMAALDSRNDCATRFAAAEKISSDQDRDLAYSQIALGAIDCHDDDVLLHSVHRISDPTLRDDTAYRCVVILAKAGRGMMAGTLANEIVNSDARSKAAIAINQIAPDKSSHGK